jgi:hypothetical protein
MPQGVTTQAVPPAQPPKRGATPNIPEGVRQKLEQMEGLNKR